MLMDIGELPRPKKTGMELVRKPRRTVWKKISRPLIAVGRLTFGIGLILVWPVLKRIW